MSAPNWLWVRDACEVQVQPKVFVLLLALDVLEVLDDG